MRPIRDYPRDDYDAVAGGPTRLARLRRALSTAIGAAIALALLVTLGVWFYRLGARDAENVPIIRASAEPTKTRPEEPGGAVTPYQEITSYEVAGSVEPPTTAAVIAPPPPEPRREDVPMGTLSGELAGQPAGLSDEVAPVPEASPRRPLARPAQVAAKPDDTGPEEPEIAEVPGAVEEDGGMTEADEIAALVREATLEAAATPKPDAAEPPPAGGEADSAPLPPARPSDLKARIEASVRSAEESAADLALRAAESPFQIQLATDPDDAAVRTMWHRISQANSDILHNRELAVQKTVSGGITFYRLRVGPFADASEARAVCQALKARGQDCIVARNG
jgi:hypothetical protein